MFVGEPLKDFTNMAFLDRFVFRNPKMQSKDAKARPVSRMQSRKVFACTINCMHTLLMQPTYLQYREVMLVVVLRW
jgi:hypothetical protein